MPFAVRYLDDTGLARIVPETILGRISFGSGIAIRPLAGLCHEVWLTDRPVIRRESDGIASAHADEAVFASLTIDERSDTPLETLVQDAYTRLFGFIDALPGFALLRVWHYIPHITADLDGMQRYYRFNIGRHEAFIARHACIQTPPAASALGSYDGRLTIFMLATRHKSLPIENPRQVSAYQYPPEHGPRSPTFSRAALGEIEGQPVLLISGTASIVGHESRHIGDIAAQTAETIVNLKTLLAEAGSHGFAPAADGLHLKVYVRHPGDVDAVRAGIARDLPAAAEVLYLHADICRPELLVEIEAVCF